MVLFLIGVMVGGTAGFLICAFFIGAKRQNYTDSYDEENV